MKKLFWLDIVVATILVFIIMWGILRLTQLNIFNAFDSIGTALSDVELTDYVFWGLREEPLVDQNIVLVNIGELTRGEIAQQINIISKYHPKVIGLDTFFDCPGGLRDTVTCPQLKDEFGNLLLAEAIRAAGNVVLVTKVEQSDSLRMTGNFDQYDSLERSDSIFTEHALAEGYANLDTDAAFQDDVKTCRQFTPRVRMLHDDEQHAWAVKIAMIYDDSATQAFLNRRNEVELINYRGNVFDIFGQNNESYRNVFYTLDVVDVFTENFTEETLNDKIVLLGFMGRELGDPSWSDKFYTPLNNKMAGKANPDMFGVVVHANIVSMILSGEYLTAMSEWQEVLLAFLLCMVNVAVFAAIFHNLPDWYDGVTKLLQIVELLLLTVLMVYVFHWFNYKMNVTLALAAVALAGDTFEVYEGVVKRVFHRAKEWFTSGRLKVSMLSKRYFS